MYTTCSSHDDKAPFRLASSALGTVNQRSICQPVRPLTAKKNATYYESSVIGVNKVGQGGWKMFCFDFLGSLEVCVGICSCLFCFRSLEVIGFIGLLLGEIICSLEGCLWLEDVGRFMVPCFLFTRVLSMSKPCVFFFFLFVIIKGMSQTGFISIHFKHWWQNFEKILCWGSCCNSPKPHARIWDDLFLYRSCVAIFTL